MPSKPEKAERGRSMRIASTSSESQGKGSSVEEKVSSHNGSSGANSSNPISIEQLFSMEDACAETHNIEEDLSLQSKLSTLIRRLMNDFNKAKTDDNSTLMFNVQTEVLVALAQCRRLSRLAHFHNRKIRDKTSLERQKLDDKYLQLQNLLYEVMHLKKEVKRCLEFKSGHEEIDLVPLDVFYKEAPTSVSNKEVTEHNSHQLRLARLQWELEERKGLAATLEELEREDAAMSLDIEKKITVLDSLQPLLKDILQSSRPVQKLVGIDYEKRIAQRERQAYLPEPLHVIYSRATTFRDIVDKKVEVFIEGDFDAAKERFAAHASSSDDKESGDDSEPEEPSVVVASSDRVRDRTRRKTVSDLLEENRQHLSACDPLYLILRFPCRGKGTVTLTFNYAEHLEVVTVKCQLELSSSFPRAVASARDLLSTDSILQNLITNDTGNVCLNPTGNHKLEHAKIEFPSLVSSLGACYKWAQDLAGLSFDKAESKKVPTLGANKKPAFSVEEQNRLQTLIKHVKDRVVARLALHDQIASLEALNFLTFTSDCVKLFPAKIISRLTAWRYITFDDFKVHPAAQAAVDNGLVSESGWHFQLTLERGDARLVALVFVRNDYPLTAPLFCIAVNSSSGALTMRNNEQIRYMERVINFDFKLPPKSLSYLLCCQVAQLACMLDVILELESERVGLNVEPMQNHLFTRKRRCRDHQLPVHWNDAYCRYLLKKDAK